mgnify:CR=1 FL=1
MGRVRQTLTWILALATVALVPAHTADAQDLLDRSLARVDGVTITLTDVRAALVRLFDVQLASRHCDMAARWLRSKGRGYYTIGSAGHESNGAVSLALRPDDPALLHYRSGAFYLARAGLDGVHDVMSGVVASADEPIAGGRHKVFGRHDLAVIPQTSTIASHLPRAVGVAFAIGRAEKLGIGSPWRRDALAVCSFGDASANHSVATGAINTALHCAHQHLPLPLLFVCEEAHRYAPANSGDKFMPTRQALARIAKEGRKYGVSLALVAHVKLVWFALPLLAITGFGILVTSVSVNMIIQAIVDDEVQTELLRNPQHRSDVVHLGRFHAGGNLPIQHPDHRIHREAPGSEDRIGWI